MSQLTQVLKRGWTVLRNDGPAELFTRSRNYLQRVNVSSRGITVSYQTGTRVDFQRRWELLREWVDPEDSTVLDIGCAEGHLTAKFAEMGLMSIGIERHAHSVATARSSNAGQANLGFLQYDVTPETVDSIPTADIILLLTVYHHWVNEYGWENAEEMLRSLESKCDTLFFEVPGREMDRPPLPDYTGDSLVEYYTAFFEMVYGDEVTVEHLGTTDYKGDDRDDIIFLVDLG